MENESEKQGEIKEKIEQGKKILKELDEEIELAKIKQEIVEKEQKLKALKPKGILSKLSNIKL